jgi:hypothetical protein
VITMTRELCQYPIAALRAEALHYQGVLHGAHHERCLDDYGELATFLLGICFCHFCRDEAVRRGVDAPRLAVRCQRYLTGVFDSDTRPHVADAESISTVCGDEIFTYLCARGTTVTRLAQEVAKESAAAGVRLSFIDQTIPAQSYATGRNFRPGRDAVRWQLGVEPSELAEAGVPLEVPAYLARIEDVSLAIDWYREQAVDPEGLSIVLRPGPPDLDTHGGLADKVAYAAGLGCAEVNFYAYGLYRLRSLDLIHAALR